jgi:hypothetical protein
MSEDDSFFMVAPIGADVDLFLGLRIVTGDQILTRHRLDWVQLCVFIVSVRHCWYCNENINPHACAHAYAVAVYNYPQHALFILLIYIYSRALTNLGMTPKYPQVESPSWYPSLTPKLANLGIQLEGTWG